MPDHPVCAVLGIQFGDFFFAVDVLLVVDFHADAGAALGTVAAAAKRFRDDALAFLFCRILDEYAFHAPILTQPWMREQPRPAERTQGGLLDRARNSWYHGRMDRTLPPHYPSLAGALVSLFGSSVAIDHTDRVSGGDISRAYALTLNTGARVFMKANARQNVAFFTAEAAGIAAIASTGAIGTPHILCTGTDEGEVAGYSFLLQDYVEFVPPRAGYWEQFARNLAAMHEADTGIFVEPAVGAPGNDGNAAQHRSPDTARFGFFQDTFIGATPQTNTPAAQWIPFFREQRLEPQFRAADEYFTAADRARNTRLLDHLESFLVEPERPSLLHGDLWSGNVLCAPAGALLIDPAASVGHAEADLAMTELFGGFPPAFYAAYREAHPLQPGYEDRRDLYNLYHLLNHLNLFGAAYRDAVTSVVCEYVG